MMTNGIPGIENIGGDIDKITGKRCTFFAFPWRWPDGEGCALRVVAVLDPTPDLPLRDRTMISVTPEARSALFERSASKGDGPCGASVHPSRLGAQGCAERLRMTEE